ncbi:DoxX family protein [Barrientosiimonas endolithica]|uniref:Membrane protein n=2 Tax=Barrientosiimonas TaxID=1535207 RepID=A0ABM8HCB3_9MICO|nr:MULTISPECIES: DoxX family protein [Barrientosiimonas]BDZ58603.1 membrane protein [Barrientosiimonas endolithica]
MFAGSGVLHLVRPQIFEPIVPRVLPAHRELVLASGVAEIACAAGLLAPRTRRVAGIASAALLLTVLPANVQMALDAQRAVQRRGWTPQREVMRTGTLLRLPLQAPLVRAAWRAGR